MTLPPFPVDAATLDMLETAIDPWKHGDPEAPHSSVGDFLELMSRLGGSDTRAVEMKLDESNDLPPDLAAARIWRLSDPAYHPNDVILALVAEIRRLRSERESVLAALRREDVPAEEIRALYNEEIK